MNFIFFNNDFIALIPELFLVFSINCLIFYAVVYNSSSVFDFPLLITNILWLSLQVLLVLFCLVLSNCCNGVILNKLLIIDDFGKVVKSLSIFFMIIFMFYMFCFCKSEGIFSFEFVIVFLFGLLGFLFLISSNDLLGMYLSVELISFSSYILAAFKRSSEFSTEAGLKYFILGAFSSNFLLFGCSLIYGSLGTCNFESISIVLLNEFHFEPTYTSIFIGLFFILTSIFFKLSAAPFHLWSPDVYEGSLLIVTTFFSTIPKLSLFSLLTRFLFIASYGSMFIFEDFILLICAISMFIGCLGAIWQIKIKRFLAYSAINNIGFMLYGFCCNSIHGIFTLFFYCVIYIIGSLSIFSILLVIYKNRDGKRLKYIRDLNIIFKQNYVLGIFLAIVFFSIGGIPPLAGFLSKMFLLLNMINNGLILLALFAVIISAISCFYYLRVIQLAFFDKNFKWVALKKLDLYISFFISLFLIFFLICFLHPTCLIIIIYNCIFNLCL